MSKGFGFLLIIFALAVGGFVAAKSYNVEYWLLPSKQKFAQTWVRDVKALEESGKLPEGWGQIRQIVVKTNDSPAKDWVIGLDAPIKKKQDGVFQLDIFIVHWIDNDKYGALIEYKLVDLRTKNTTWELSRNLPVGRIL